MRETPPELHQPHLNTCSKPNIDESEISDTDDLDYVPQGQYGVVGVNPALLDEEGSFDGIEDLSDESSKRKLRPSPID
ncbi:hypothetical protein G5714_016678 [Onychostoma macrolepis]|uniref:Uncharacterized protein n=1 Tax=Onychostoma macrolepis TaxID=369639 RepID=A0A7J6C3L3_9TELE|nr:hypothetical protein G5714_016678 [Onychostoma macrolepis]